MKLVVGLGNPTGEYKNTRHNIGFIFLDAYLKNKGLELSKKKFNALYIDTTFDSGEKVIFVEPQTYMNLSGEAVRDFAGYYKVEPEDVLIIHDDLDLEFGKIRIRSKGASGGHNGIKNIIAHLGGESFKRIRIGIGKDENIPTIDYVLGKLSEDDLNKLKEDYNNVFNAIDDFINGVDFHKIESKYN